MADLVLAGVLGAVVTLVIMLALHQHRTERQLSDLRLKVARDNLSIARAAAPAPAPTQPQRGSTPSDQVVRRKRHLGLIRGGGAAALLVWLLRNTRQHQPAVVMALGATAVLALGAIALLSTQEVRPEPAQHHPAPISSAPQAMPSQLPVEASPGDTTAAQRSPARDQSSSAATAASPAASGSSLDAAAYGTSAPFPPPGGVSTDLLTPSVSPTTSPSSPTPEPQGPRPGVCVTLALDPSLGTNVCLLGDG